MKRRNFLHTAGAASLASFFLHGTPLRAHSPTPYLAQLANLADETDRVLVLIQLNGGNDGLNTVIPLDQYDNLSKARPNLLIPENQVLKLDNDAGFHPGMTGLHSLYKDDLVAVVQSVGYPSPNFSHFRSKDIWTSGSPATEHWNSGWAGRFLDEVFPNYPNGFPSEDEPHPPAITIGSVVSQTCQGEVVNLGLAIKNPSNFNELLDTGTGQAPNTPYGHELTFLRETIRQTNQYLEIVQEAATNGTNVSALYPENGNKLADQLKIVAQLISGGLKTRIYVVNLGGFDTHANQVEGNDPTDGKHNELLTKVSEAIAAFQDDMEQQGYAERVLGMTFSEFGRRIASNDSNGTDHGAAAPMILFGPCVNPGIFGANPVIPEEVKNRDSLPMLYDFRSVYGSVLMDWFGLKEKTIKDLLYDEFSYIPVLQTYDGEGPREFQSLFIQPNFPNPFVDQTTIRFRTDQTTRIKVMVFDSQGRLLEILANEEFIAGNHEL
ncbi:MAG: DUF1501 domain-containing protein, partial [Bacteroidota bacterium]